MSEGGRKVMELAEGIRELLKKHDPKGELELSREIDDYISQFGYRWACEIEERQNIPRTVLR